MDRTTQRTDLATADHSKDQMSFLSESSKRQPWKAHWPAPREPQSQANIFGFKKGETMVFDGNAGNFFTKEKWQVGGCNRAGSS
jgi:hypothetical protein